ncbi:MAG: hypothetical protein LC725_12960, partial [Lentisphaerae bacterium]|nr:hypothetical protein [Lentisphaerota bacterium]
MQMDDYQSKRRQARGRPRRIIFNNDGCDARRAIASATEFLNQRTAPLAGTQVDTISYCTSEGFGLFRHNTRIGSIGPLAGKTGAETAVAALIAQGTDPLRVVTEFGHAHGLEVFWSMRMNWDQDGRKRPEYFEANRFKQEHPDCLMGARDAGPYGHKWAAVDYNHEQVRAMALACIGEVCRDYAVDGVELDFFRQPVFFRNTLAGRPVNEEKRGKMTEMIRQAAALCEREGRRRGRPILLAVRTADDPDYAATIGLDIEQWMREDLVDIYIPSGYFRLRDWRDSVALGHRYGVRVYAGLSESRVGGRHHADWLRASDECYRARAANAWQAGADGVYLFNIFDTDRRIWRELGDPSALRALDKVYVASVRGPGRISEKPGSNYPFRHFIQLPVLTPGTPLELAAGDRRVVRIEMAEHIQSGAGLRTPKVTLLLKIGHSQKAVMTAGLEHMVLFNGHQANLEAMKVGWSRYALEADWLRRGWNTVEVMHTGATAVLIEDAAVTVDY